jgi:hypothetical protein
VDAFGDDKIFGVFGSEPSRVQDHLPPARAEKVLEGWRVDLERRSSGGTDVPSGDSTRAATDSQAAPRAESPASGAAPGGVTQTGESAASVEAPAAEEVPAKSWGRRPRRTRSSAE